MSLYFEQEGNNNIRRKDVLLWKADLRPDYAAIEKKENNLLRDGLPLVLCPWQGKERR